MSGGEKGAEAPSGRPGPWEIAAALLPLLILAPTLLFPFGRDQAVFAYVGQVIAEGGMPYRDAWDLKPPGIYLAYALLAHLAPGVNALMLLVRGADVLLAMTAGVLLARLCAKLGRPEAGPAAAAWYAALYLQGGFWSLAQAEAWANPLVLGAALLIVGGDGRALAAAGALAGAAALLKFTAPLPLLAFLPLLPLLRGRPGAARLLIAFAAGAAGVLALSAAWLAAGRALGEFVAIQSGFVAPYTRLSAGTLAERAAGLGAGLAAFARHYWGALLLALAYRPAGSGQPAPPVPWRTVPAALGLAALAVCVQGKYFQYHWSTALPFVAVAAAIGACRLLARVPPGRLAAAAAVLPLAWTAAGRGELFAAAAVRLAGGPAAAWEARFTTGPDFDHGATVAAAARVRELTAPGDGVLVWGFEPAVYLHAGRRAPTRFFFNVPVAVEFAPAAWREEFLADLRADPPEGVVVLRNDAIPWASGLAADSEGQLAAWPELAAWLAAEYEPAGRLEDFRFLRLRRHP